MWRYIIVSVIGGILFGVLDGVINANSLAQKLLSAYSPIARKSVNVAAGISIDLAYAFILAALFLLLYQSLPGQSGFVKGLSFGLLTWFSRVVMSAASTWVMFEIPATAILYNLVAGLGEMLALGIFYGVALRAG